MADCMPSFKTNHGWRPCRTLKLSGGGSGLRITDGFDVKLRFKWLVEV